MRLRDVDDELLFGLFSFCRHAGWSDLRCHRFVAFMRGNVTLTQPPQDTEKKLPSSRYENACNRNAFQRTPDTLSQLATSKAASIVTHTHQKSVMNT